MGVEIVENRLKIGFGLMLAMDQRMVRDYK